MRLGESLQRVGPRRSFEVGVEDSPLNKNIFVVRLGRKRH